MPFKHLIKNSDELITSKEATKAGFISFALEKNKLAAPYIEQAKILRCEASKVDSANKLLNLSQIKPALLTASGLSDKSLQYFNESDKDDAIKNLIDNFLEPAGSEFINELVYRYLLIKGDSLGGSMRNIIGSIAEQKFIKAFIAALRLSDIQYKWVRKSKNNIWEKQPDIKDEYLIYSQIKAVSWIINNKSFVLVLNLNIPVVKKNVDVCIFEIDSEEYISSKIKEFYKKTIVLGEIKGGIDPAGADEHWKTANTALNRIRKVQLRDDGVQIKTIFIGAAIEKAMADEIFLQLQNKELDYAANLMVDNQLSSICIWLVAGNY